MKLQVRVAHFNREHDLADDDQAQAADQNVPGGGPLAGSLPGPLREGERHRNSHHEQKGRHDEVVENRAAPRPVLELLGDVTENAAVGELREPETIGYQQNHDESAKSVQGQKTLLLGRRWRATVSARCRIRTRRDAFR